MNTVAITGNTYPVKDQIKALGGRWDAARKAWMVPADRADAARRLVTGGPQNQNAAVVARARARRRAEYRNNGWNNPEDFCSR